MFALPFLAAFSIFELIFCAVFFLLLIVGASFDRHGREEPKWWIFGIGFVAALVWFWKDWSFSGIWAAIQSWTFWQPVCYYFLAGLVYSLLEFGLDVRRSARYYKQQWLDYSRKSDVNDFVNKYSFKNRIIELAKSDETGLPEPRVNKAELAEHIGAWTFFWPAYLLSLIIGDLLTELFDSLSELLVKISGRFVKWSFSDVFK